MASKGVRSARRGIRFSLRGRPPLPETAGGDAPIFLVIGVGKSGTGWLMRTLNSHPEVLCKGEGKLFGQALDEDKLARIRAGERVNPNLPPGSLYGAITGSEPIRLWVERSIWTKGDDPGERLSRLAGVAADHFLREELAKTKKRIVGDKTPLNSPSVAGEISAARPGAKVIHIIRDGRDQAISLMHHMWRAAAEGRGEPELEPRELAKRDDFYRHRRVPLEVDGEGIFTEPRIRAIATRWMGRVAQTIEDGPRLLGEDYTEVRYEDLLERPEQEARRLFDFLGADTGAGVVRRCVETASFEALSGRKRGEENYELVFENQRKGTAGDWRNVFTERDKAIYKEVAGDLLIRLGYAEDHDW